MRSTILRKLAYPALLALVLSPLAFSAVSAKSTILTEARMPDPKAEANSLLSEIKWLSGTLTTHATTLESYRGQPKLSWQTHADQLTLARHQINEIGKRLDRLQDIKYQTEPWQQQAIEQIVPVAAEVADHTQSAILHLNENRGYLLAPVYADHLTSISESSVELKDSVDAFLEYGDTSEKLDRMQQKLDRLQDRIGLSES
ncbi:MAG TPA: hypothetical protein VFA65_07545 [Bryobacteraceae bacterium]|nr:hypothetical protein [Bryobacteraceae bacterium]